MRIKVGNKYQYGFGDGKTDTVKVLDIFETSDGKVHVKYRYYFNWVMSYVETDCLDTFKRRINSPIIIKTHKEI